MNSLTTNWNAAAFYNAKSFRDVASGVVVTIGANKPVDVRALEDAVNSGAYVAGPDSLVALPTTISVAALATDVITVTVQLSAVDYPNAKVFASSSDVTKATVTASDVTDSNGEATFTVTGVAAGSATITLSAGGLSDTVAVTVT